MAPPTPQHQAGPTHSNPPAPVTGHEAWDRTDHQGQEGPGRLRIASAATRDWRRAQLAEHAGTNEPLSMGSRRPSSLPLGGAVARRGRPDVFPELAQALVPCSLSEWDQASVLGHARVSHATTAAPTAAGFLFSECVSPGRTTTSMLSPASGIPKASRSPL